MAAKKKPTTKKAPTKKAAKGKRYTKAEKAKILAFVESQGRGGQSKAAKKFGVSPLTISNWRKSVGGATSKPKSQPKVTAKVTAKASSDPWTKMVAIKKDIDIMEAKLAKKREELRKLASQL